MMFTLLKQTGIMSGLISTGFYWFYQVSTGLYCLPVCTGLHRDVGAEVSVDSEGGGRLDNISPCWSNGGVTQTVLLYCN